MTISINWLNNSDLPKDNTDYYISIKGQITPWDLCNINFEDPPDNQVSYEYSHFLEAKLENEIKTHGFIPDIHISFITNSGWPQQGVMSFDPKIDMHLKSHIINLLNFWRLQFQTYENRSEWLECLRESGVLKNKTCQIFDHEDFQNNQQNNPVVTFFKNVLGALMLDEGTFVHLKNSPSALYQSIVILFIVALSTNFTIRLLGFGNLDSFLWHIVAVFSFWFLFSGMFFLMFHANNSGSKPHFHWQVKKSLNFRQVLGPMGFAFIPYSASFVTSFSLTPYGFGLVIGLIITFWTFALIALVYKMVMGYTWFNLLK